MTVHDRFIKLITDHMGPAPEGAIEHIEDQFLVELTGPVHMRLDAAREDLVFSAPALFGLQDVDAFNEAIGEFNTYHLFNGGYWLFTEERFGFVFLSQRRSLAAIETTGVAGFVKEFLPRLKNCQSWLEEQISGKPNPTPEPPSQPDWIAL